MIFGDRPPRPRQKRLPWRYDVKKPPKRCYLLFPESGLPLFFQGDVVQSQPATPPGISDPGKGMGSVHYTWFARRGQPTGGRAPPGVLPVGGRAERILGTAGQPAFEHPLSPPKANNKKPPLAGRKDSDSNVKWGSGSHFLGLLVVQASGPDSTGPADKFDRPAVLSDIAPIDSS